MPAKRILTVLTVLVAVIFGFVPAAPAKAAPAEITFTQVSIALGDNYPQPHVCGITTENTLYCWGDNEFGELGLGDTSMRLVPTQVGTNVGTTRRCQHFPSELT